MLQPPARGAGAARRVGDPRSTIRICSTSEPGGEATRAAASTTSRRHLIGWTFLVDGVGGTIVEVEAYREDDPASHSYRRPARTQRRHVRAARAASTSTAPTASTGAPTSSASLRDSGAAVLLRALEPTHGLEAMRERRGVDDVRLLCSGPGRLTQALGITAQHNGLPIDETPFELRPPETHWSRHVPPDRDHQGRRAAVALPCCGIPLRLASGLSAGSAPDDEPNLESGPGSDAGGRLCRMIVPAAPFPYETTGFSLSLASSRPDVGQGRADEIRHQAVARLRHHDRHGVVGREHAGRRILADDESRA